MRKRWLILVAATLTVVALAIGAVALFVDPNAYKGRIIAAVQRATGRTLQIAGPIRLTWGLSPGVEATDIRFANMPSGTRPFMVSAAKVAARIALLPLLHRRVEITSITLVRPDILVETDANGRGNWQFQRPETSPVPMPPSPASAGPRIDTAIDRVQVEDASLQIAGGAPLTIPHATLDIGGDTAHLVAATTFKGIDFNTDATIDRRPPVAGQLPFALQLAVSGAGAMLSFNGEANPAARLLHGQLDVSAVDLADLSPLGPKLPPLHDVHLAATLLGWGVLPENVTLHVGASDLGLYAPGATLAALDLTWPKDGAARLAASGSLGGAAWKLGSGLMATPQGVALRGLSVTSGLGDLAGDVALGDAPRPSLKGTLVSNRLDIDGLRALRSPSGPVASAAPVPTAAPPPQPAPRRLFSTAILPWSALNAADADLQLSAASLILDHADYHQATGHLVLHDGVGRLDAGSVQSPAGRVDFSASADGATQALALAANLPGVPIDTLLQAAGLPGGSSGAAELDLALHGAGPTPDALAASVDGHAGLALVNGELSNTALAALGGSVLRKAGLGIDPGGVSAIRCLALRLDAHAGQVSVAALKLDTSRLLLEGGGTMNLADETLDLHLRPLVRMGGAGLMAPVTVEGPILHPSVALDPIEGRVGVTIGGLAGPGESCAAELVAARDGHAGPMPAEVAVKPLKPADLLRSLLR